MNQILEYIKGNFGLVEQEVESFKMKIMVKDGKKKKQTDNSFGSSQLHSSRGGPNSYSSQQATKPNP